MVWALDDISFDIVLDLSAESVVTVRIDTPSGLLFAMAEIREDSRTLVLERFHIHADEGRQAFGHANLRVLADHVMEVMDYDEIIVEGAARTSGARPSHIPHPLRFTRRHVASRRGRRHD